MPVIDIIIAIALAASIVVGLLRGFVKEAISIATLVIAIWAALFFGPAVGNLSDSWVSSEGLQMWFGRMLVFTVILLLGGLLGWAISKMVRLSVLSGVDRLLGSLFGVLRGILLVAVFIIGGQFAGFDKDGWWLESRLLPYFEVVADWIKVVAPQGYELIVPSDPIDDLPIDLPKES